MYKATLKFLKGLKANNNKEWFDKHRPEYDATREQFAELVQLCIDELGAKHNGIRMLSPKDCIFRINKDVRFSKDKSPYKTTYSAFIAEGGRKSNLPGFYFHIEPGNKTTIGGGIYLPDAVQMKRIRSEIASNGNELQKILSHPKFKKLYPRIEGEKLVKVPKGYDPASPFAELLKHKNFFVMHFVSDKDVENGKLPAILCSSFKVLESYNSYLKRVIE